MSRKSKALAISLGIGFILLMMFAPLNYHVGTAFIITYAAILIYVLVKDPGHTRDEDGEGPS